MPGFHKDTHKEKHPQGEALDAEGYGVEAWDTPSDPTRTSRSMRCAKFTQPQGTVRSSRTCDLRRLAREITPLGEGHSGSA